MRQRGGTFLGFVIGAVFGLALALGVAIYITKVPIPFMNKNQPRPAEGGAAEAQKNKDWDPNAALPGRVPPKPQPGASETTEPISAGAPAAESRDPLGDLARSRSEAARPPAAADAPKAPPSAKAAGALPAPAAPPAPPAPPTPKAAAAEPAAPATDPLQYFVQAGAFRAVEEAEQMRARLSLMGLQARVSEREQAGRVVFRVRLGPFDRREDAEKTGERLEAAGITAALVRVQR
jgi:cell division protein FtsN